MLTFEQRLERFSPVTCRLLARRVTATGGCIALTDEEVAAGSGLSVPEVAKLSRRQSWNGVPVDVVLAFTKGCGVNLSSRENLKCHEKMKRASASKGIPRYLRTAPHWEQQLKPMLLQSLKSQHAQTN